MEVLLIVVTPMGEPYTEWLSTVEACIALGFFILNSLQARGIPTAFACIDLSDNTEGVPMS